jgi:hypothetical protein
VNVQRRTRAARGRVAAWLGLRRRCGGGAEPARLREREERLGAPRRGAAATL